jgi:hypothetical protein
MFGIIKLSGIYPVRIFSGLGFFDMKGFHGRYNKFNNSTIQKNGALSGCKKADKGPTDGTFPASERHREKPPKHPIPPQGIYNTTGCADAVN